MRLICFGEIMLRLNPVGYLRFAQADSFEATYAGGEANVAVSLSNFGKNASFVSKLPDNDIASAAIRSLKKNGVDVSKIIYGGDRIGIYFVEKGASQRPSKVIYDRKNSSIATALQSEFNWDDIFEGGDWFHFTGITPALSSNAAKICLDAVKKAKEKNLTVSCDLNYRKNLWTSEEANQVMSQLMPYVDLCIANEEDADMVFGIRAENTDVECGTLSAKGYRKVAKELAGRFGIKKVAITLRESLSATDNNWAGMLYNDGEFYHSQAYKIHIVDRVGGGDSFGAGLIYALSEGYSPQGSIEFAVAASCLKHTIEHDFNYVTVDEVKKLARGNGSGRVIR